jgi:hypothetical protein
MLAMHDTRRCLYCLEPVAVPQSTHACDGCGELLHAECFELNHGCSTYGCIRCEATPAATSIQTEVASIDGDHTAAEEHPTPAPAPVLEPAAPAAVAVAAAPRSRQFCGRCGGRVGAANHYGGTSGTRLEDPS